MTTIKDLYEEYKNTPCFDCRYLMVEEGLTLHKCDKCEKPNRTYGQGNKTEQQSIMVTA